MSSGADGSAPGPPALDPMPGPEPNREPPVPQAPEPAPQQEAVALEMEAPAPAPQQEAVALRMEAPEPAPQQEVVALRMEALAPAPQQEVVALQVEAPMPAVTIVISRPGDELHAPDAKGVSPASSPQAGGGKATAASVSVTAAVAAKEAELARSDSFDDYEQCR